MIWANQVKSEKEEVKINEGFYLAIWILEWIIDERKPSAKDPLPRGHSFGIWTPNTFDEPWEKLYACSDLIDHEKN